MNIFKKKEIIITKEMLVRAQSIIIVFILVTSFATFNFAYGQIEIFPTPDDFIFKHHSLIIDIASQSGETGTIPIKILVMDDAGNEIDVETFDVSFDSSWGMHRIVVVPSHISGISGDGIVQASQDDKIHIQDFNDPETESIVIFIENSASGITTGTRTTFSTMIDCPDVNLTNSTLTISSSLFWSGASKLNI